MCQVEYEVYSSVWEERWVQRSRKPHTCASCGTVIPIRSRYLNTFSVTEGEAATEAQCEACEKIADRFAKEHNVGKPWPSSLIDYIDGCVDSGDEDSQRWKADAAEIRTRNRAAVAARKQLEIGGVA